MIFSAFGYLHGDERCKVKNRPVAMLVVAIGALLVAALCTRKLAAGSMRDAFRKSAAP